MNTLIIFIDSVSRAHMYRTMPKVMKWLDNTIIIQRQKVKATSSSDFTPQTHILFKSKTTLLRS